MVDQNERPASSAAKPLAEAKAEYLEAKRKTTDSGNYANELDWTLDQWLERVRDRDAETVGDLSPKHLRSYAQYLRRRARARESDPDNEKGITGRTARQYFALVRAFLNYCDEWGWIDENPAAQERVQDELPDPSLGETDGATQTWSVAERRQLVTFVDERARSAIDERGLDAETEARDRAIVSLLAYTGARSAELFRDPGDDRRRGLYWADLDAAERRLTVLGKSQVHEAVQYPEVAHDAVAQYKRILDPPTDEWPVFPTRHTPTIHNLASSADADHDGQDALAVCREHELTPPSITTTTVRTILRDLCDAGDIDVEGDHEYLKPHGARRGVGKQLYKQAGHEAAQKALRHSDPETTSKMYADIGAGEVAAIADSVFEDE